MFLQNPLNESSFAFPILETVHVIGMVCGVGTAAVMSLRLCGIGMTESSPSKLWRDTMLLTLGGLTLAILSGLMLFSIDPGAYISNPVFHFKLGALLAAILFYYTVVRWAALRDRKASIVAGISLAI
jgi:hypothetical protein